MGNTKICPTNGGYILIDGIRTSGCVPFPFGKALSLQLSTELRKILKSVKFVDAHFRKSMFEPYSLKIRSFKLSEAQTICGVELPKNTFVQFDDMESDDDSFEVRPTTPIVANGRTYPKYNALLQTQHYRLFNGKKCSVEFSVGDESDEEDLDPFK